MTIDQEHSDCLAVEYAVLSVMLNGRLPGAWAQASDLTHEHFFNRDHRLIWLAITSLAARGETIDANAVSSHMGGMPIIESLQAIKPQSEREAIIMASQEGLPFGSSALAAVGGFNGVAKHLETFAPASGFIRNIELLRRYRDLRKARQILAHYERQLAIPQSRDQVPEIAVEAADALRGLCAARGGMNLGQAATVAINAAESAKQARIAGKQVPLSWGVKGLDHLCPLHPGSVYVVAAASGHGKTSLALQAAMATAKLTDRAQVAIAALEMSGPDLALTLACRELGMRADHVRNGTGELSESDWSDLRALAAQWTVDDAVHLRDMSASGGQTIETIIAWLNQRHQTSGGLSLAVIDYLQLLEGSNPKWTEYQRLTHTTRAVKQAAIAMRVPIILLAQLNRRGTTSVRDKEGTITANPEPSMSDLKGSSSIENDADAVILLHRVSLEDGPTRQTNIIVAKNRRGGNGVIETVFRGAFQMFEEPEQRSGMDSIERQEQAEQNAAAWGGDRTPAPVPEPVTSVSMSVSKDAAAGREPEPIDTTDYSQDQQP